MRLLPTSPSSHEHPPPATIKVRTERHRLTLALSQLVVQPPMEEAVQAGAEAILTPLHLCRLLHLLRGLLPVAKASFGQDSISTIRVRQQQRREGRRMTIHGQKRRQVMSFGERAAAAAVVKQQILLRAVPVRAGQGAGLQQGAGENRQVQGTGVPRQRQTHKKPAHLDKLQTRHLNIPPRPLGRRFTSTFEASLFRNRYRYR